MICNIIIWIKRHDKNFNVKKFLISSMENQYSGLIYKGGSTIIKRRGTAIIRRSIVIKKKGTAIKRRGTAIKKGVCAAVSLNDSRNKK